MHGRSLKTVDPRIPTNAGTENVGFLSTTQEDGGRGREGGGLVSAQPAKKKNEWLGIYLTIKK